MRSRRQAIVVLVTLALTLGLLWLAFRSAPTDTWRP